MHATTCKSWSLFVHWNKPNCTYYVIELIFMATTGLQGHQVRYLMSLVRSTFLYLKTSSCLYCLCLLLIAGQVESSGLLSGTGAKQHATRSSNCSTEFQFWEIERPLIHILTNAGLIIRYCHLSALAQLNEPTAPLVEQLGNVLFYGAEATEPCECECQCECEAKRHFEEVGPPRQTAAG